MGNGKNERRIMAHFRADIQGSRGPVSRLGGKRTGISGHLRGWHVGAHVYLTHNETTGKDEVQVYRTSGSSGGGRSELVAEFTEGN
ncbi:hypothetical protein LCGC14_0386530 [marine sediment metagenome]|uniref:Uncharacterized protein n=1 Tax=marine sediment metagenome TaxID=412755 RepID=A0A0F9T6T9_9ZZZZ